MTTEKEIKDVKRDYKIIQINFKVLAKNPENLFSLNMLQKVSERIAENHSIYQRYFFASRDADALCDIAEILRTSAFNDQSEEFFKTALLINPYDTYALEGLGTIYLSRGNHDLAKANFYKALEIDNSSSGAKKGLEDIEVILKTADSKTSKLDKMSPLMKLKYEELKRDSGHFSDDELAKLHQKECDSTDNCQPGPAVEPDLMGEC